MSTLSPITSGTTPLNNSTIVGVHSDSIIPSFDDNDFLQNYCCDFPAESKKLEPDEPIEIPVSKKMVFKFAKPRKVLLY
jgi:hypothetical protein